MDDISYSGFPLDGHSLNSDTCILRTVSLVPTKSCHIFSNLSRLQGNTNNGHFSVSRVTNSHISSTPLHVILLSGHRVHLFPGLARQITSTAKTLIYKADSTLSTLTRKRSFSPGYRHPPLRIHKTTVIRIL